MRNTEDIQAELDEVSSAIHAIVTGAQSYTIGTRSVTRADLTQLRLWRSELLGELGEAEGSSVRFITWRGR